MKIMSHKFPGLWYSNFSVSMVAYLFPCHKDKSPLPTTDDLSLKKGNSGCKGVYKINTNDKNYTKVNITGKIKNSIWKQLYMSLGILKATIEALFSQL